MFVIEQFGHEQPFKNFFIDAFNLHLIPGLYDERDLKISLAQSFFTSMTMGWRYIVGLPLELRSHSYFKGLWERKNSLLILSSSRLYRLRQPISPHDD